MADRGSRLAVRFSVVVGLVGAVICKRSLQSAAIGNQSEVEWIGLVFLWCGVGLRIWSFRTFPYRVIRHPGYAGILLVVVGLGFVLNNWASLLILVLAIAGGLVYRITVEERALSSDLGGRYQSYAQGRKRLVPFVW